MMSIEAYQFANLGAHEDLLEDLRRLESRMREQLGYEISLIAYTPETKDISKK
ncbi:hypothetical protein [Paenibacillus sp. P36]|uniref:hypothetical protein n=1 Tax=Paenibacillus sp. P36 TaxID=3342538 RepID=UPI0038B275E9